MSAFVDDLGTVFESFGSIRARRMFGGYGIYHDDCMFALVADDELYLKADAQTRGYFEALGLGPFEYVKQGRTMKMSYFAAPAEMFDDPEQARLWATRAFDAAARARKQSGKAGKKA